MSPSPPDKPAYWPHKGMTKFVCHEFVYASDDEEGGLQLTTEHNAKLMIEQGFMSEKSKLVYEFEAGSWVEAMQEHNKRQGYGPYIPADEPDDA